MKNKNISFKIERLDPLGQGVSKINDKITFIPKTLPGEEGKARVTGQKKGVQFAQVTNFTQVSHKRVEPECPHFQDCSGCNYLHMDYETEAENKKKSFERLISFSPFNGVELRYHNAPRRNNYRNRIQLHYDLKNKNLGFFKGKTKQIHSVPSCILPLTSIQETLQSLYENNHWINLIPLNAPSSGHLELFIKDDSVNISWNKPYASGGFSQVNKDMNDIAINLWNDFYNSIENPNKVFDVFGGSGNLSRCFINSEVQIFDSFCEDSLLKDHQSFKKTNLYKESHPPKGPVDLLLFDPPRSGFKEAVDWINALEPRYIGYQSCFADTMMRDLKNLPKEYAAEHIHLLDFFPGTHHYESIIFIKNTRV